MDLPAPPPPIAAFLAAVDAEIERSGSSRAAAILQVARDEPELVRAYHEAHPSPKERKERDEAAATLLALRNAEAAERDSQAIPRMRMAEVIQAVIHDMMPAHPKPEVRIIAGRMSARELASKYDVDPVALRSRLDRWRRDHDAGYIESTDPARNEPKYLYDESAVMPIIDALKTSATGRKRATDAQQKNI